MARNIGLKVPYDQVWEKVKSITGWEKDVELAAFLEVQPGTVSGARQRDAFPLQWAFRIAQRWDCSTDWLMSDKEAPKEGLPHQKKPQDTAGLAAPPKTAAQGQDITDAVNITELLNMTAEVLVSNTVYRPALAANIKAFHRSIALEHDNQELRSRVDSLETRLEALEQREAAPEKKSQAA